MATSPVKDIEQACSWWKDRIDSQWSAKATEVNAKNSDDFDIRTAPEKIYLGDRLIEQYLRAGQVVVIIDYGMPTHTDVSEIDWDMETYDIVISVVTGERRGEEEKVFRRISRYFQVLREIVKEGEDAFRESSRPAGGNAGIKAAMVSGFDLTNSPEGEVVFRSATVRIGTQICVLA